MPSPTPFLYESAAAAAHAGAQQVAEALREAPDDVPLALGVSGGSTPAPLYRALADEDVPWHRLQVFWIDERFVPSTDERSNERLVREALLNRVPIPAANIHPVPTHLPTAQAAADAYDATLRRVLGDQGGLTVAVLGVGEDGHTASLFPGQPLDHPGRRAVHTPAPDTSPVRDRITVTRELIADSSTAFFLVTGMKKQDIVVRCLCDVESVLPAAKVHARDETIWLLDREAAGPCGVALKGPGR